MVREEGRWVRMMGGQGVGGRMRVWMGGQRGERKRGILRMVIGVGGVGDHWWY